MGLPAAMALPDTVRDATAVLGNGIEAHTARAIVASAREALPDLPRAARFPVAAIIELLEAIIDELERRDCDSLKAKVRPSRAAVLGAVWRAWRAS